MNNPKRIGNVVTFNDRFGDALVGIVVRETYFGHCLGASSVTVLAENGQLYGMGMFDGGYKVVAEKGDLQAARKLYRAHLMQYPVWAVQFATTHESLACGF